MRMRVEIAHIKGVPRVISSRLTAQPEHCGARSGTRLIESRPRVFI
jgi:hypothetical protein